MVRANGLDRLRELRLRILDDVSLVQNTVMPVHLLERIDIVPNDFVRGDDDIVLLEFWKNSVPFARVAIVHDGLQVVNVLLNLVKPVTSQSRGANDERREMDRIRGLRLLVTFLAFVVLA